MLSKKIKCIIYLAIFLLIFNIIIPVCVFAIDEDNVYVWSDNSSEVSSSTTPDSEDSKSNNNQDKTRKFFGDYIWKCNFNGSKNWNCFICI